MKPYKLDLAQMETIDSHVESMLNQGVIRKLAEQEIPTSRIHPIFAIPKSSGGYRVIVDLRRTNELLSIQTFSIGSLKDALAMIEPLDFLTRVDIKDAFWHIPIYPPHHRYLGFQHRMQCYAYQVLPFGLATAPLIFTKVMRAALTKVQPKVFSFIDDLLIAFKEVDPTPSILHQLRQLGFLINLEKSDLIPSRHKLYLGMELNTIKGEVTLPSTKLQLIQSDLTTLASVPRVRIKALASVIGRLNHARLAAPQINQEIHFLVRYLATHVSKNQMIWTKNPSVGLPLDWIQRLLHKTKTLRLVGPILSCLPPPMMEIFTDASTTGWGVVVREKGKQEERIHGWWGESEVQLHINRLELKAAQVGLQAVLKKIPKQNDWIQVILWVDSTTTLAWMRQLLSQASMKMIHVSRRWIPSAQNPADHLSRLNWEPEDYSLPKEIFNRICLEWNLNPTLELFAAPHNALLPRFVTRMYHPAAWAVDALSLNWGSLLNEEVLYANPPFSLLGPVVKKVRREAPMNLLLVIPTWKNRWWYLVALQMATRIITLPIAYHRKVQLGLPNWNTTLIWIGKKF